MPRDISATVQLKVRMKEPLRAKIEAYATRRGISMNKVIVDRVERTFREEEFAKRWIRARNWLDLGAPDA